MKKNKTLIGLLILIALVLATIYVLIKNNDLKLLLHVMVNANHRYLLIGLALMLLFITSESIGIHTLLTSLGYSLSILQCLKYSFLGFYYSGITPSSSGGQPVQVYYMNKDGVPVGDSSLCIMIITISYNIGMLLICLFFLFFKHNFIMENLGAVRYLSLFGAAVNITLMLIYFVSAFNISFMKKLVYLIVRLLSKIKLIKNPEKAMTAINTQLERYNQGVKTFAKKPGVLLLTLVIIMIQILSRLCVAIVVYLSFNLRGFGFWDILSLEAFLALGIECLPLPGSAGAAEAGFITVNRRIFGSQNLVPAALLTRGISFYFYLIVSGVISIFVHINLVRREQKKQ